VRQIHAEIVEPHQLAIDETVRLAKIHLRVPRLVAQRYEHLAAAQLGARHIIANNGDATGEAMLIAQTLENAGGSVSLLAVYLAVIHQDLVDDLGKFRQLAAVGLPAPAMRPRFREAQHLVDGLAVDPKIPGGSTTAHSVNQHGAADLLIKLHSLHPPPPPKSRGLAGLAHF
jgi:hypothetical protein